MTNELYKQKGSPDVYVKGAEGKLQHIADPEAFKAGGFDWGNVTELPQPAFQNLLSNLGTGKQLTAADFANGASSLVIPDKDAFDTGQTKNDIDSFYKSQQEQIANTIKAMQERDKQMAEQQAKLQEERQTWKERLFGQPSLSELETTQAEKYGIPEQLQQQQALITDMGTLRERLDKLDVEMQNQIALMEEQPVSLSYSNREKSRIRETYSRQMANISASLNAKAATLQALQGNLAQAQSFADKAVNAAIYDQEQDFKRFEFFYNENKDFINSLDKSQQRDLDRLLNYQSSELDRLRAEKTQVMNLSLQYPLASITADMTLDEATAAAQRQAKIMTELDIAQQQANIARTRQLAAGGGETSSESQYMRLYNEAVSAGYKKGFTDFLRERGVIGGEEERVWSNLEIKSAISAIKDAGGTKADAIQEIDLDPTIKNKEEAKKIAKEYFSEEEEKSVPESFFGRLFYGITHPTTKREFTITNK